MPDQTFWFFGRFLSSQTVIPRLCALEIKASICVSVLSRVRTSEVTRRIIGWSLAMEMTAELVISALQKAIGKGFIKVGAIVHSDRGSQ